MRNSPTHKILLADDDPGVCKTLAMVLSSAGYEVRMADHEMDAILMLQTMVPDVLIYELNLVHVPGYNFLSMIRKRLPQIGVIAISSAWNATGEVPEGIFADYFYAKGQSHPEELLRLVDQVIRTRESLTIEHREQIAQLFTQKLRARLQGN